LAKWRIYLDQIPNRPPKRQRNFAETELLQLLDPALEDESRKKIEESLVAKGFPRAQLPTAPKRVAAFVPKFDKAKQPPPPRMRELASYLARYRCSIPEYQPSSFKAFMVPQKYAGSMLLTSFKSMRLMGTMGISDGMCVGLAFWYGHAGLVAHLDSDSEGIIGRAVPALLNAFLAQITGPMQELSLFFAPRERQKAWIIIESAPDYLGQVMDDWGASEARLSSSAKILRELMHLIVLRRDLFPHDISLVRAGDFLLNVNEGVLRGGSWKGGNKRAQFEFGDYPRFYRCPPGTTAHSINEEMVKELARENVTVLQGWKRGKNKLLKRTYRI